MEGLCRSLFWGEAHEDERLLNLKYTEKQNREERKYQHYLNKRSKKTQELLGQRVQRVMLVRIEYLICSFEFTKTKTKKNFVHSFQINKK